ncbi:hypothetical protein M3J09_005048 [Ascochyta lentis]
MHRCQALLRGRAQSRPEGGEIAQDFISNTEATRDNSCIVAIDLYYHSQSVSNLLILPDTSAIKLFLFSTFAATALCSSLPPCTLYSDLAGGMRTNVFAPNLGGPGVFRLRP